MTRARALEKVGLAMGLAMGPTVVFGDIGKVGPMGLIFYQRIYTIVKYIIYIHKFTACLSSGYASPIYYTLQKVLRNIGPIGPISTFGGVRA